MYTSINGKIVTSSEATIPVHSEAVEYGYGLFETMLFEKNHIYFFEDHWSRLQKGIELLRLNCPFSFEEIKQFAYKLCELNELTYGKVKLKCLKNKEHTLFVFSTQEIDQRNQKGSYKLKLLKETPIDKGFISKIKSTNYLNNFIFSEIIQLEGFDEGIFINSNGHLLEGTKTNLFFVKENKIHTPSSNNNLLEGIIRQKLIDLLKKEKIKIDVGDFQINELLHAEEVFVTNAILGIMPVSQIEDVYYETNKNYRTLEIIKKLYHESKKDRERYCS